MEEIQVPTFFICPISLEIMRDPVTVWTGITYDRDSIERWIFSGNNRTCPVTKQALTDTDLTPNHTLRRLIQAWCTLNASYGVERIPTPRPPIDKAQIAKLMEGAMHPKTQMGSLQKLNSIAGESERNRRCMEDAGVVTFLASILKNASSASEGVDDSAVSDEALSILYYLRISQKGLYQLVSTNTDFIASLTHVLQRSGNCHSRAYATFLLKSIFEVLDPVHMIGLKPEMFSGVVNVLRDQISHQATKAALQILMEGCPWGRNRIKVVSAGGVSILVELLLEVTERRDCEMMLAVLDHLCGCAEGRAELLAHGAGLPIVSKKILRVSHVASEKGVRILSSIAKFSATPAVLQEMLRVGVVSKLCFVLQLDCSLRAKEKAKEILSLHIKAWKKSPCVPTHLLTWHTSH